MATTYIGNIILKWRRTRGYSQARLEKDIGKGGGYIARVEGGIIVPPRAVCEEIAVALGFQPDLGVEWRVRTRLEEEPELATWVEANALKSESFSTSPEERKFLLSLRETSFWDEGSKSETIGELINAALSTELPLEVMAQLTSLLTDGRIYLPLQRDSRYALCLKLWDETMEK